MGKNLGKFAAICFSTIKLAVYSNFGKLWAIDLIQMLSFLKTKHSSNVKTFKTVAHALYDQELL